MCCNIISVQCTLYVQYKESEICAILSNKYKKDKKLTAINSKAETKCKQVQKSKRKHHCD